MASRAGFESEVDTTGEGAPPPNAPDASNSSSSQEIGSADAEASAGKSVPTRGSNDSNSASDASDNDSSQEASEVEDDEEEEDDGGGVDASCCDVCGSDASWEDSPIILCDGCDVAVHSLCFGVKVRILHSLIMTPRNWAL
jgi:hypothetical protein